MIGTVHIRSNEGDNFVSAPEVATTVLAIACIKMWMSRWIGIALVLVLSGCDPGTPSPELKRTAASSTPGCPAPPTPSSIKEAPECPECTECSEPLAEACSDAVDPRIDPADDDFVGGAAVVARYADERDQERFVHLRKNADLDGDGKTDSIQVVGARDGSELGFRIRFATGEVHVLGAGRSARVRFGGPADRREREGLWRFRNGEQDDEDGEELWWSWGSREEWPEHDECETDFGGLEGWTVLRRGARGGFRLRPGPGQIRYRPPGAVGDALLLDGGDAFGIYYFNGLEWLWVHPGV